jgi:dienelactone hydrolase
MVAMKVEPVTYSMGEKAFLGALVHDEAVRERRPALLMAPNWMGATDAATERAAQLAGNGYVVFVVDMYGKGTRPKDFGEAAALANPLREDPAEARRRMRAAYDAFIAEADKRGLITAQRAAVGFCFGGGNVLELARDGATLHAAVSIHGDLKTAKPAEKGAVKSALLAVHGAPDPVVPKADRDAFEAEMDAAGAKWQMLVFSGILHAYTDQGMDVPGIAKWDEPATRQTYALTHAFIADAFAGKL